MELNKEEKIMLKSNLELINEWVEPIKRSIRENINIPIYHKGYDMTFNINNRECFVRVGNNAMFLTDKDGSERYDYFKILSNHPSHAMQFIINWKSVRNSVEKEIDLQRKALDNLSNFQL
jgi:hypothetical protein